MSARTFTVGDREAVPVDAIARRVTSPGPQWCARDDARPLPPIAAVKEIRARNPTTKRLMAAMDDGQRQLFSLFCREHARTMAERHGFARYLLGLDLPKHQQPAHARFMARARGER